MALRAARAGARVLIDAGLPRPGGAVDVKSAGDYVTAWDRRSESAILEVLAREAPGIAVLAEERGGTRAGTMWAVDPLDGTTNFTRGFPSVGVSVGLLDSGLPVLGVVIAPFFDKEFVAARGKGATLNGERLPLLRTLDPSNAVVALVLEVGGRVTDWSGGDSWAETGNILAASPAVHEALLELAGPSLQR